MKNRLYLTVMIVLLLVLCVACKSQDDSSDTNDSVIDYYQVHSLDSDLTFDDLVDYLTDKLGVEYYDPFETGSYKYQSGYAQLFLDYSQFIEMEKQDEIEYNDPGRVQDYEYHIKKKYNVGENGDLRVIACEFDSLIIARMFYKYATDGWVNEGVSNLGQYIMINNRINGAFLLYKNDYTYMQARYLIGRTVISFSINEIHDDLNLFITYIEVLNDLDLPVSDEISEAIMNAA